MKRVTTIGFVGLICLAAACGSMTGQEAERVGQASSALVDKSFPIGDMPVARSNRLEILGNVAAGAGVYVVAWGRVGGGYNGGLVTRLSSTGEVLDPHGIPFPKLDPSSDAYDTATSVAFDGTNFLVTNGEWQRWAARLTPQGEWLDAEPSPIDVGTVACLDDGDCFAVQSAWWEEPAVHRFVRIDESNRTVAVPGTPDVPLVDTQDWLLEQEHLVRVGQRLAYVETGAALVGESARVTKIWVEFFDPKTGAVTTPIEIASTALGSLQTVPVAVAGREGELLVVWAQQTGDDEGKASCTTLSQRIGTDGKPLEAVRTLPIPAEECGHVNSLFFTGSDYILASGDYARAPTLRRLSATGELTDATLSVGRDQKASFVSLAGMGDSMLLATGPYQVEYPEDLRVFTKAFKTSGEELGLPRPIEAGVNHMSRPAVAWNGQSYMTVWADDRNGVDRRDLFGARVSPDGTQLDATALPLVVDGRYWSHASPAIATSGQGYLLVDQAMEEIGHRVLATYVDADGKAAPSLPLGGLTTGGLAPAVAWNGRSYLVAWVSEEEGVRELYATRFDERGVRIGEGTRVATIAPYLLEDWSPVVAATPDGFFVGWREQDRPRAAEPLYEEQDVRGAWLDDSSGELVVAAGAQSLTDGPVPHETSLEHPEIGVACSPRACAVAWNDEAGSTHFRRFDQRGEALGPVQAMPSSLVRPLLAWDGSAFLVSDAEGSVVAGYLTESGQPFTPTLPLASPDKATGLALATDGNGHGLLVTAGDAEARLTGIFVSQDAAPEANGGAGGMPQGGEPGTTTAGSGGEPLGGAPSEMGGSPAMPEGGAGETNAGSGGSTPVTEGGAGETSAGSGGSSAGSDDGGAGSPEEAPTTPKSDQGCGCSVAGGDTSHSPWLLLGLLGLAARRRKQS